MNPEQQLSPELQALLVEAMFWKQKYFELLTHSNQVIGMLSKPAASPEQVAQAFGPPVSEPVVNVAQNGAQPPGKTARGKG